MFSLVCFTFRCELISNVQNTPHTTSGSNRGKNIVSDCCIKIATTPSRPKMSPIPLSAIDAWSSIFCFSITNIGITTVYESMFLQLQKNDEKNMLDVPFFQYKGARKSGYFLSELYSSKPTPYRVVLTPLRNCGQAKHNQSNLVSQNPCRPKHTRFKLFWRVGGRWGIWTPGLLVANQTLFQLS